MSTRNRKLHRRFCGFVARQQYLFVERLVSDATRGALITGDTMFSDWARSLREKTSFKNREKRLSRAMNNERVDERKLLDSALELLEPKIRSQCVAISVDTTHVRKEYARVQPGLTEIWDPLEKEYCNGYNMLRADAVAKNGSNIPVWSEMYSNKTPGYAGMHDQLERAVDTLQDYTPKNMPWLFDAGNDSKGMRKFLFEKKITFVKRLVTSGTRGRRKIIVDGKTMLLEELLAQMDLSTPCRIKRNRRRRGGESRVLAGAVRIRFAGDDFSRREYTLAMVKARNKKPLILLSDLPYRNDEDLTKIIQLYSLRWCVEDGHRLMKSGFNLENLRGLRWRTLRRTVLIILLASMYLAWLAHAVQSLTKFMRGANIRRKLAPFPFYALLRFVGRRL